VVLRVTLGQHAALAARRAVQRIAEELPLHEASLADWPTAALKILAREAYDRAQAWGLVRLPDHLFFALTMLRVHPRFDEVPAIRTLLLVMHADGTAPQNKVARLVDELQGEAWEAAGALGGYEDYFRRMLRPPKEGAQP
jgi:hypothetical protein